MSLKRRNPKPDHPVAHTVVLIEDTPYPAQHKPQQKPLQQPTAQRPTATIVSKTASTIHVQSSSSSSTSFKSLQTFTGLQGSLHNTHHTTHHTTQHNTLSKQSPKKTTTDSTIDKAHTLISSSSSSHVAKRHGHDGGHLPAHRIDLHAATSKAPRSKVIESLARGIAEQKEGTLKRKRSVRKLAGELNKV